MMNIKSSVMCVGSLLLSVCSGAASAFCAYVPGGTISPSMTFSDVPPIDRHAPMDSVLATITARNTEVNTVNCSGDTAIYIYSYFPLAGGDVYQSGIPGIGLKISVNGDYLPANRVLPSGLNTLSWGDITFELIKIGEIAAGGRIKSSLDTVFLGTPDGRSNLKEARFGAHPSVVLENPTCTVDQSQVAVDLKEVSLAELEATGRSPEEPFSIELTCSGGTSGGSTDVHVTLTDQADPSNTSTQLGLSRTSVATGVEIEVRNKHGLVNFGADSAAPGNPGQWFEGSAVAGSFSIPLTANYVKTATDPTPGSANATATYTLSYQ